MRSARTAGCLLAAALALAVVAGAGAAEPEEFVEENGKQIPVLKAVNDEDYDDSDVLVLDKNNFEEALSKHSKMLVEFYAPWCGHCKSLKPEYGAAATRIKRTNPEVVLAKFDAVAEGAEDIAKQYNVEGFPTMKWFVDGKVHPKDCFVREAEAIVKWVAKRSGPPVAHVVGKADMEAIKAEARYAVVGFFADLESSEFKIFSELASHDDEYDFHYVDDAAIAKGEGVAGMPQVVFYRNFDEPTVVFDKPITAEDLATAVRANSRPRLIEMTEATAPQIFDNDLPKLLLFRPEAVLAEFKKASDDMELRGHFIFATVGEEGDPGLGDFLGVDKAGTAPELFLFEHTTHKKYRLDGPVSAASIKAFTQAHKDGTVKPFLKAAAVLEDWDASAVKAISSSQWEAVVLDKSKHVIVEVYAPWCGHCQKLEPLYLKAAEHMESKYGDELVFVKMDGTLNEVEDINIGGFPTVLAFKKDDKTPVDLSEKMHGATAKTIVKEVKAAFGLSDKKREGEVEYEAAAKRFKDAVKALRGSLLPAAEQLDLAARALEKLVGKKDEL